MVSKWVAALSELQRLVDLGYVVLLFNKSRRSSDLYVIFKIPLKS